MRINLALSALLLATLLNAESVEEAFEGFDDDTPAVSTKKETTVKSDTTEATSENDAAMEGFDDEGTTETSATTSNEPEMEGFDDESTVALEDANATIEESEEEKGFLSDFSGKFNQQAALSYNKRRPQNVFYSLRQTLFLNYDHKFDNGLKVKITGRAFYDGIYDVSSANYYPQEIEELNYEVELFEAYVEWSILDNLDAKLGRQVVIWGRSDTIRITDILNPIDNRRPGIQDIEDVYLPVGMLKFDYQLNDNWRISPIVLLEQRFTKDPPFGSLYNPLSPEEDYQEWIDKGYPVLRLGHKKYNDPTFALSVGAEFEGWDVNFYASRLYEDRGYIPLSDIEARELDLNYNHNKTNMYGAALNTVYGSWLLKAELAYFSGLTYTTTQDRTLSRSDMLLGFEYSGISETTISYDFALRHFNQYDPRLYVEEENLLERDTYQQAFRVRSNFLNDTLHANYLVTAFGQKLDQGGYQRGWVEYEVADAINADIGAVDYFGGTPLFDLVSDQIVVFMDMSYNF